MWFHCQTWLFVRSLHIRAICQFFKGVCKLVDLKKTVSFQRLLPKASSDVIFNKKCWIAETIIAEHAAHTVVSARRPICRAHILFWFALSRACDIWHLHMWLSTATTLVRKPETLSKCTAGWLFLREGREDLSSKLGTIELWWDCFASGPEKTGPSSFNLLANRRCDVSVDKLA